MNWLIIQSAGLHDGSTEFNPNNYMRECFSIKYALEQFDNHVDIWGLRFDNFEQTPDFESFDYIFCIENYDMDWLPDFTKIKKPVKIQWIIDLHFQKAKVYKKLSTGFDIILHSTNSLIPKYRKYFPELSHIWFPNAFDERFFTPDPDIEKKYDLVFVGNILNRRKYIKKLGNQFGLQHFNIMGSNMIKRIIQSKIHFNKSVGVDINYRNFETIALGTCLCTNYNPELLDLGFKDEENCLIYKNLRECKDKITSALENSRWKAIGLKGIEFSKNHTFKRRIEKLLDQI